MRCRFAALILFCFLVLPSGLSARAQAAPDSVRIRIDTSLLPESIFSTIEALNVRDADLRDVLRGMAASYGVNVIADSDIQERVTLGLENVTFIDAAVFLARRYSLSIEQSGSILRFYRPVRPPPPAPLPRISVSTDGLLSVDFQLVPLLQALRLLTDSAGVNFVVAPGTEGVVSGYFQRIGIADGIAGLFSGSGFSLTRQAANLYAVERLAQQGGPAGPVRLGTGAGLSVTSDSLVALDVQAASAAALVQELARRFELDLVVYAAPTHSVTARARALQVEEALDYIFRGSEHTYRYDGRAIVVGARGPAFASSRLIRLEHLPANRVLENIPQSITSQASIRVIPEHNALLVQATGDLYMDVARLIAALDQPAPLILIEALVVDFDEGVTQEIGLSFRRGLGMDSLFTPGSVQFGGADGFGSLTVEAGSGPLNRMLSASGSILGLGGIGRLPADFYARIRALESQGRAKVVSRPQISTLSGHAAMISVGTTQYYILRTSTPVGGGTGGFVPFESERFERVDANVRVEVTPWVTASGEVVARVKPEFSTPVGRLSPNVPPTINTRTLEANVRLRDGETIILGGLIQETESEERSGIPFLSRLPVMGRLFRSSRTVRRTSELVIYMTPHIFYGGEADAAQWEALRERLRLTDPEQGTRIGHTELPPR